MRGSAWLFSSLVLIGTLACGSSSGGGTGGSGATTGGAGGAVTGGAGGATTGGAGGAATGGAGGATTGGAGGGVATGGAGGATATGGAGGAVDAGAGGSGGSATGGAGGSTGGAGGTGTGGTTGADSCAACETCFKDKGCQVIDNDCNDDIACNPKENEWHSCVCRASNAAQVATCDATFGAVGPKAQKVIECAHTNCPVCNNGGGRSCKGGAPECGTCALTNCAAELGACMAMPTCNTGLDANAKCVCSAQMGQGTVPACLTAFMAAGGTAAITCLSSKCGAACGL